MNNENIKVRDPLIFKKSLDKIKISISEFGKFTKKLEDPNKDNLLSQLMENSLNELNQELFTIGIIGSSESSLISVLNLFFPDVFSNSLFNELGLDHIFIIKSDTNSYQIRSKIGNSEFSSIGELFENLKEHQEKRTAKICIPWNESLAEQIQFILIPDVDRLILSPALNSFISNLCYSLIISFSQMDDCNKFKNTIEQVITPFEYIFFYEYLQNASERKILDEGLYLKKIFPTVKVSKLPMLGTIYPGVGKLIPSLISSEDQILRSAIFARKKSLEIISVLTLAGTDIEEQRKEFLEKKQSLSKLLLSGNIKDRIDKIREGALKIKNSCQLKFTDIEQSIRETQAARLKDTKTDIYDDDKGETSLIDRIVKINPSDLSMEKKDSKFLKVTFTNRFLGDIKQLLIEEIDRWNQRDLEIVKTGIKNLTEELKNLSELHYESAERLEIPSYNYSINSVLKENEIILRYQFLIPNYDNFLNIFAESRSAVMSVIMLGSALFGIFAFIDPSLKKYTGTTAILGLVSALGLAVYKIMNRENTKNERLLDEKEKLVDYLASEILKLLNESNKSMQEQIFRENKDWLNKLYRATEEVTKDVVSKYEAESLENRKMLEKKITLSDQKIKNSESIAREHQKTLQDLNRTIEMINQDFQKLSNGIL